MCIDFVYFIVRYLTTVISITAYSGNLGVYSDNRICKC